MKELTLDATTESIPVVADFVAACLEEADCPMKAQLQLAIAVDELFSNIVFYAYAPNTGRATVQVALEDGMAAITFIDEGLPYNPLETADPDTTLSADERKIGGLGIFMVKKTMDEMTYARLDGRNVLTIKKKI